MRTLNPPDSIVAIVRVGENRPIKEILGTGFVVGKKDAQFIATAKHVIERNPLQPGEKYGYVVASKSGVGVYRIAKVIGAVDYDVAICEPAGFDDTVPLAFSRQKPSLNQDVFCYEYSGTRFERTESGGTNIIFEPMAHKGNIMRYFESDYPQPKKTPSFIVSFPALQGASGAPVLSSTLGKQFYVAGMIVANIQRHLLPAQVVTIRDGENYTEQTSYFLPLGQAIDAPILAPTLQTLGVEVQFVE